jgi:hypothetical protein
MTFDVLHEHANNHSKSHIMQVASATSSCYAHFHAFKLLFQVALRMLQMFGLDDEDGQPSSSDTDE